MIHVVSLANQHLYARQLDQMFRMRHSYYIEGHGWADLVSKDGRETDEFDDENAHYLMSLDPFGDVAASVRLNPTTGPTLLKKFAAWSDEDLPSLDSVWDISRWIAAPHHRRSTNPRWPTNHQRELMIGILEFCQSRGLTHLIMLAELRLAERIASYGWPVRHLGAPRDYEGGKGTAVAAEITMGHHVLALTRAKTRVFASMLVEIDPARLPPTSVRTRPSPEFCDLVEAIGSLPLIRLMQLAAAEISEDRPRAIELTAVLIRLLESAGMPLDQPADPIRKQPGLSTGLPLQFGATDRS